MRLKARRGQGRELWGVLARSVKISRCNAVKNHPSRSEEEESTVALFLGALTRIHL
jgi:hypothetical protein